LAAEDFDVVFFAVLFFFFVDVGVVLSVEDDVVSWAGEMPTARNKASVTRAKYRKSILQKKRA
jgi:hypothetical protein